jgi:hypothetical protein
MNLKKESKYKLIAVQNLVLRSVFKMNLKNHPNIDLFLYRYYYYLLFMYCRDAASRRVRCILSYRHLYYTAVIYIIIYIADIILYCYTDDAMYDHHRSF